LTVPCGQTTGHYKFRQWSAFQFGHNKPTEALIHHILTTGPVFGTAERKGQRETAFCAAFHIPALPRYL
jgi:hypothetical protein